MSIYIRVGEPNVYPYELTRLAKDFPSTSFVQPFELNDLAAFDVYPVQAVAEPTHNHMTHRTVELPPADVGGVWTQQWELQALTPEEAAAQAVALQREVVTATQTRLDAFAKTRNYDGILSACTYATSSIPKFQAEGQYAVQARDATWAALYQVLEQVQLGTRPAPTGYQDIEPELPVLAWPEAA